MVLELIDFDFVVVVGFKVVNVICVGVELVWELVVVFLNVVILVVFVDMVVGIVKDYDFEFKVFECSDCEVKGMGVFLVVS